MRSKGQKTERRVLKQIKARPQPNSGAMPGMPHDGIKGRHMIEVKSTVKGSMSIKREWLEELERNAILHGRIGTMILVFNTVEKRETTINPWVAMSLFDFEKFFGWKTR